MTGLFNYRRCLLDGVHLRVNIWFSNDFFNSVVRTIFRRLLTLDPAKRLLAAHESLKCASYIGSDIELACVNFHRLRKCTLNAQIPGNWCLRMILLTELYRLAQNSWLLAKIILFGAAVGSKTRFLWRMPETLHSVILLSLDTAYVRLLKQNRGELLLMTLF